MKRIFHIFKGLFKRPLPLIFLIVNWIGCAFLFDWKELSLYLGKINETGCKPKPAISFGIYDSVDRYSDHLFGNSNHVLANLLNGILLTIHLLLTLLLSIFLLPTFLLTTCTLDILKDIFSHWCPETFELLEVPVFTVFNSIYWAFLANIFEYMRSRYSENNLPRKNPLSIYSK